MVKDTGVICMKTLREDKSDKKIERENRIAKIFHDINGKELKIEETVDVYLKRYSDDQVMNYRIMSAILKDMCDSKMLSKERRFIKENKSGRIEAKSVIYYKESKLATAVYDEAEKASITSPIKPIEDKIDQRITKPDILTVEEKKEEPKKKTVVDLLTTLSFDEALGKLYRGSKVVSAVSGNIYAMIAGKGITSTENPGAIVTTFPALEMEGNWRVLESPKGCPFCGYPVKLIHENLGEKAYFYCCTNHSCMAHGPRTLTPELAVLKFNERVG